MTSTLVAPQEDETVAARCCLSQAKWGPHYSWDQFLRCPYYPPYTLCVVWKEDLRLETSNTDSRPFKNWAFSTVARS